MKRSIFYITGQNDAQSAQSTQQLYDASPSVAKRLAIIPSSDHGIALIQNTNVADLIIDWLNQQVLR